MNSDHYRQPLEGRYRGRGVASGFWGNGGGQSSAILSVNPNGTVNLQEGRALFSEFKAWEQQQLILDFDPVEKSNKTSP